MVFFIHTPCLFSSTYYIIEHLDLQLSYYNLTLSYFHSHTQLSLSRIIHMHVYKIHSLACNLHTILYAYILLSFQSAAFISFGIFPFNQRSICTYYTTCTMKSSLHDTTTMYDLVTTDSCSLHVYKRDYMSHSTDQRR